MPFLVSRFRIRCLLIDGQISVFLRDLQFKQRGHIGRLLLRLRLSPQLSLGLRLSTLFLALIIHHRINACKIILNGRKQFVKRKRLQTFFQLTVFGCLLVWLLV